MMTRGGIHCNTQAGISLLIMAMMIMLAAISITAILPDEGRDAGDKVRLTQMRMQAIQKAMENFQSYSPTSRLLPCPAPMIGTFNYTDIASQTEVPNCNAAAGAPGGFGTLNVKLGDKVVAGAVPVGLLNLPADYMVDGWGNKFIYVVDSDATFGTSYATGPSLIQVGGIVSGQPTDLRGRDLYNKTLQYPVALIISAGPNGNGSYSASGLRSVGCGGGTDSQNCNFSSDMTQYISDRWRSDLNYDDILLPVIFNKKSCKEAVPCNSEQSGTGNQKNTPEGCVTASVASRDQFPTSWGSSVHNATRTMSSGSNLRCCDGAWYSTATYPASCP